MSRACRFFDRKRTTLAEGDLDNLSTEYEDLIKLAVEKVQGVTGMAVKAFDESEHPRDGGDQFTSGGSGDSIGADSKRNEETQRVSERGEKDEVYDVRHHDKEVISRELGNLYADALQNKQANRVVSYADVTPEEAKRIKDKTGFEVGGYEHTIDAAAIRHINDGHGSASGPLAITAEDIKRIPEIIADPDDIEPSVSKRGENTIRYKQRFNGTVCYVEVVGKGKKRLATKTMYKEKAGGPRADSG